MNCVSTELYVSAFSWKFCGDVKNGVKLWRQVSGKENIANFCLDSQMCSNEMIMDAGSVHSGLKRVKKNSSEVFYPYFDIL